MIRLQKRKWQDRLRPMSEWLDIMLSEIARKRQEEKAAKEEAARRAESASDDKTPDAMSN
jgi:hypothetical protein